MSWELWCAFGFVLYMFYAQELAILLDHYEARQGPYRFFREEHPVLFWIFVFPATPGIVFWVLAWELMES
jgi:hypothetical protein